MAREVRDMHMALYLSCLEVRVPDILFLVVQVKFHFSSVLYAFTVSRFVEVNRCPENEGLCSSTWAVVA